MKRIISLTLIILILITLASCSGDEKKDTGAALKVYHSVYDALTPEALKIFKETNKTKIEEVGIASKEYYTQLNSELLNGEGPDIILIDPLSPGTEELLEKDVFLDITKLTDDKVLSGCNQTVMDGILIDNKRYLIPICYTTNTLVGLKKTIDSLKADVKDNGIYLQSLVEMSDKATGNSQKPSVMDSSLTFSDFLLSSGINGTAIYSKTGGIDNEAFARLLSTYKTLTKGMSKEAGDPRRLLTDKKCTFIYKKDATTPEKLLKDYSQDKYRNNEIIPINMATDNGDVYAAPQLLVGINKNCKNPDAAMEFINILLGSEIQSMDSFLYTPVNKEAYEKKLEAYGNGGKTAKLAENVQKLQEGISGSAHISYDLQKLLNDKAKEFIEGKTTAEATIGDIRNSIRNSLSRSLPPTETAASKVSSASSTQQTSDSSEDTEKEHLKMYLFFDMGRASTAVKKYNLRSMGAKIDVDSTQNGDEFTQKFTASMLAGDGPDIIVAISSYTTSLSSMAKNGAFFDLDTFMKNDPEMKLTDYYKPVIDSGVIGGKRYFIPLNFSIPALVTTGDILKKNDITIDEKNWTWDKVLDIATQLKNENSDKFLFDQLTFKDMLRTAAPFYSFENKTSSFNSTEFIKLLKIYKEIYPFICTQEEYEKYGHDFVYLPSGKGIFQTTSAAYVEAWHYHSVYQMTMNQEAQFYLYPSKVDGPYGRTGEIVGINAGCKNKEDAYKYLKFLLNECPAGRSESLFGAMPSNKTSHDNVKNVIVNAGANAGAIFDDSDQSRQDQLLPILDSHVNQMHGWIEKVKYCNVPDTSVDKIIDEQVKKFLLGQQTAEQTAKVIDQKVKIFLNE